MNPFGPPAQPPANDDPDRDASDRAAPGPIAGARGLQMLAGGIAHDLNNALAAIIGNAELAGLDLDPDTDAAMSVREIVTVAKRAGIHIRQLLAFSGQGRGMMEPLHVAEIAAHTCRAIAASDNALQLHTAQRQELHSDRRVVGDRAQLQELVAELVTNAISATVTAATRGARFIGVETTRVRPHSSSPQTDATPGRDWVALRVIDNGEGMAPAVLQSAADPYYTTRPHCRGLGLSAVAGIARSHGGRLELASEPGMGTIATVYLPLGPIEGEPPAQYNLPLASPARSAEECVVWLGPPPAFELSPPWLVLGEDHAVARIFALDRRLRGICLGVSTEQHQAGWARLLRAWLPDMPIACWAPERRGEADAWPTEPPTGEGPAREGLPTEAALRAWAAAQVAPSNRPAATF